MTQEIPKRIFFWTLVGLFFLTSTALIFYAFGYRFSLKQGVFVYAGSITFKSTPQDVEVHIDGLPVSSKRLNVINDSFHINGIPPGEHSIEISAPGFATWSKKASVRSGLSTEFWNVLLTKQNYLRTNFNTPQIQRFFVSPRKNLAAITRQIDTLFQVDVLEVDTDILTNLFVANDFTLSPDRHENIEWSPQAHRLIVPAINNADSAKDYLIADRADGSVRKLSELSGLPKLGLARWDPQIKNVVYFMSDKNLFRLDLDNPGESLMIAENISGYDLSSEGLFYFQLPSGIIYQRSLAPDATASQLTMNAPPDAILDDVRLIVYDHDRIVLIDYNKHKLFIYNNGAKDTYYFKLSDNAAGAQFSDDGKKLLFWSDNEINVYFLSKWEVQPYREENELQTVTRLSQPIRNVQWTRDYEHALYTLDNKIKITELDNRDRRSTMDVLDLSWGQGEVFSDFSQSKIYFTDRAEDGLTYLHSVEFPEPETILGAKNPFFGG